MKNLLLAIGVLTALNSSAQNRLRLIMDTKPVGSVLRISKYLGDMQIPLDSMRYRGEAEVVFSYDERYTDGVYLLEVSTLESFQFVLSGKEDLNAHIYESGSGMAFRCDMSKQNDAFNIMLNLADVYSQSMDSLSSALDKLDDFNPRHTAISDSLSNAYHLVASSYNNSLMLLENLFPNSYAVQVLVPLDKIPLKESRKDWTAAFDNDPAFNHVHYFDYIDFGDERIITCPFLSNKVLEYLYNYTDHTEQGIRNTIDALLQHDNMHPKVQGFIIDLLVDFFTEKDAAEYVDYLNRKYLGNCDLPLSPETRAKIDSAVKFNPGDPMPKIRIAGETGGQVPLSALNSKLNVVVFWASWCPHCKRELPKLKMLYDQMHGDLGVYAVSIDTAKTDWLNAVRDLGLNWLNVNDGEGWNSKQLQTFGITSTPTLILLDADLKWIGRSSSFDGLHDLVKAQLKP